MKRKYKMIGLFIIGLIIYAVPLNAEVNVIVNKGVQVKELDAGTMRKIFLGKRTSWSNGERIKLVTLTKGKTYMQFVKDILHMTPQQYSLHWKRALFSGTGMPPKSLNTEEEIIQYVAENEGAIGFVGVDTQDENIVKVNIK